MVYPNHIMNLLKDRHIYINLDGCSWDIIRLKKKESLKKKKVKLLNEKLRE